MIVVSDSSPLIALAKIGSFPLLQKLFGSLVISIEVYEEVVIAGAGLAGATDTSAAPWIEVRKIKRMADLTEAQARFGLGVGELSTMVLAREIRADLIILDDLGARKLAQREGFKVQGSGSGLGEQTGYFGYSDRTSPRCADTSEPKEKRRQFIQELLTALCTR